MPVAIERHRGLTPARTLPPSWRTLMRQSSDRQCGTLPVMTRKPSPKSDESKKSKRETGREVKTDQRTKALKTTLKKAAGKDPPKEPEGRED